VNSKLGLLSSWFDTCEPLDLQGSMFCNRRIDAHNDQQKHLGKTINANV
jgi:hypothetical protein